MNDEELDRLWFEAMHQSIEANEDFVRYRFAALVAAAEREECAKVVEKYLENSGWEISDDELLSEVAGSIRARG